MGVVGRLHVLGVQGGVHEVLHVARHVSDERGAFGRRKGVNHVLLATRGARLERNRLPRPLILHGRPGSHPLVGHALLGLALHGLEALLGVHRRVDPTSSPRTALSLINEYLGAAVTADILLIVPIAVFAPHTNSGGALVLQHWREVAPFVRILAMS